MDSPGCVLVVDDDDNIRQFVSMALSDEGYQVKTASDGAVALEMVEQCRPGVILLDMQMPVMDGWAFSQEYRQKPGDHAPIIVLTAAQNAARFAEQIKAESYLPKPFDLDELLDLVGQYVQP